MAEFKRDTAEIRLVAQALIVLAFTIAAIAVGWLTVSTEEWYVPALVLIVAARLAYDHFFAQ